MSFYSRAEELILGTRLKRLSDKFLMDIDRTYKRLNIPFEVSWFPIFYLLNERGSLSITEIALELEITHSAVSQMVSSIEKKKIVKFLDDKNDKRRRIISFTRQGQKLMLTLPPIWDAIKYGIQEMFSEGINSSHILSAIDEIEDSIRKESLFSRITREIDREQEGNIKIISYTKSFMKIYKDFVFTWYLENQETDIENLDLINQPEKAVEQKGAVILLAKIHKECIGVIASESDLNTAADIKFFVIAEEWRKMKIGSRLLNEMIKRLSEKGIKKITAVISRKHAPEIKILKEAGFTLHSIIKEGGISCKSTSMTMEYLIN